MSQLQHCDVVVLGGGLAGLTLALQLKQSKPDISVTVLEKRESPAPVATHKVGESTTEIGSHYYREVLGLANYLEEKQLPKFGLRFFFSPENAHNISQRVECGARTFNLYPSHQLDRGVFENDLEQLAKDAGADIQPGARVSAVDLSKEGHKIDFVKDGITRHIISKWVVDATGRFNLLKRKLGLEKASSHNINAVWFRIESRIDIQRWSDDKVWQGQVSRGLRYLSTNHLMGEGYWVWIIPLVSGCTSIGIVADPRHHPFETFNNLEKAFEWLSRFEPQAAEMIQHESAKVMDFKWIKHFALDCKQFYSSDRWAVTGEAGAFLDAFYSPGSDFIGLGNSWTTDLILRDLAGEDILLRSLIFDLTHKELFKGWMRIYHDMYGVFGKTQVMLMKITWDWAAYWGILCLMSMNKGYLDVGIMKEYASSENAVGQKFAVLNEKMQKLFQVWGKMESDRYAPGFRNLADIRCINRFHSELKSRIALDELIGKVTENLGILESIAAAILRVACASLHQTPINLSVNPYTMSPDDSYDVLMEKSTDTGAMGVSNEIDEDISKMLVIPKKDIVSELTR